MDNKNILISGASIAGPALAYWLGRYGFTPTVVEKAPALREGGFGVDFRGRAHMRVLEGMGIAGEVRRLQTHMGERVVVDETGAELVRLPASFASGEVEIARGDLSRILYEETKDTTTYRFGDSIASMTQTPYGVDVTFDRGDPCTFDLVVGADGLHSNVRSLAFGPESTFNSFLGYYVAGFTLYNYLRLRHTGLIYNVPGKCADISSGRHATKATVWCCWATRAMARPSAAWAPGWRSWARTCSPESWPPLAAITTPRSPATKKSSGTMPGAARGSPTTPARFSRHPPRRRSGAATGSTGR